MDFAAVCISVCLFLCNKDHIFPHICKWWQAWKHFFFIDFNARSKLNNNRHLEKCMKQKLSDRERINAANLSARTIMTSQVRTVPWPGARAMLEVRTIEYSLLIVSISDMWRLCPIERWWPDICSVQSTKRQWRQWATDQMEQFLFTF